MTEHRIFYCPYGSFTDAQLPLLKVAALYFDKLVILDPVGASWDAIGADGRALGAVRQLKDAGILELVTPGAVLAKYEAPTADAIRRDMDAHEFLELCESPRRGQRQARTAMVSPPSSRPFGLHGNKLHGNNLACSDSVSAPAGSGQAIQRRVS